MDTITPSLIFITGTDGAGKSCHAQWLVNRLRVRGLKTGLIWSRFNNFLSIPLLALTRLTGHNYYQTIDGVLFGFHNFEHLKGFRQLFAILQSIDVNIATFRYIRAQRSKFDVLVCERGPWDTLVDVISDTGLEALSNNLLGRMFTAQICKDAKVLPIMRSIENILLTRPELASDYKLEKKMLLYKRLAAINDWMVIDNNGLMESTRSQISGALGL